MDNMLWAAAAVAAIVIAAILARMRSRGRGTSSPTFGSTPYYGPAEIEAYVREHATELGRELFPDNPDVKWIVHGFTHANEMILAEVEPEPDEVGYPRFKFGFIGDGATPPSRVATYCLEAGAYTLLSTAPGAPRGLPRRLD